MTSSRPRFRQSRVRVLLAFAAWLLPAGAFPQSRLLDDFEALAGWKAVHSEGARMDLSTAEGKNGQALVLEFDMSGAYGYVSAQKDFPLDLPEDYQFSFDLRADAPVNNFEFKLLDAQDNTWLVRKLDVAYPTQWTTQHIRRRQVTFGWGPAGGGEIRHLKAIALVVSSGTGGKGKVFFDNLRFEPIDNRAALNARARVEASSAKTGAEPVWEEKNARLVHWRSAGSNSPQWLAVDFGYRRELGGLVIDWQGEDYASAYDVLTSADGKEWLAASSVTQGNGGRDYVYLPEQEGRFLKLVMTQSASGAGFGIAQLAVKGSEFGSSANDFFSAVAQDQPRGLYPRYLRQEQNYWTTMGNPRDDSKALINEAGAIEVAQTRFTIEPFLYLDNKLVTWHDVTPRQSLEKGYLPIPSVEWKCGNLTLTITAFAAGTAGPDSQLLATYRIENAGGPARGKLFLAIRPFQVNPPWQSLLHSGGWARVDRVQFEDGLLTVDDQKLIALDTPSGFGATPFERAEITEYLQQGRLPAEDRIRDLQGFGSAALEYDFDLPESSSVEYHLAVPFHGWSGRPTPNLDQADAKSYVDLAQAATRRKWESLLDRFDVRLPASAQPIINTIKSNLAYIFINQVGPRIQPGARNYNRAWIRDGSLTSTALLELGIRDEVKEYADWYSGFQFPSGKVPCVVDSRGADPTVENDSHGELIYLIMQVFRFTHDAAWLRAKWNTVVKTVHYIQRLRAERKTAVYRQGTPEQRACYGLVPESISHEGYSSQPMHSYWDDFFILRGLKDATAIAGILGEREEQAEFAAERDDFRNDLYASMRRAMENRHIDYIPGCVELGDLDATSTTIGIAPVNELGNIPEPALHRTFDRYFDNFTKRKLNTIPWKDYTPYENRIIGSFVYLDQKQRAHELLDFLMGDRRPLGWNHWAEVVHRDPRAPKTIGDMPHTWCGSDFIRSARAMFVYEREADEALVVGAGIADEWVTDPAGVEVNNLPTYYGNLSYTIKPEAAPDGAPGRRIMVKLGGEMALPASQIVLKSPLSEKIKSVAGDGRLISSDTNEIRIEKLPATVTILY
ncbi:MAG TPA: discoidin domain-containing protein [Opitutaceae bacterium]|nr:discoidin domain-containing protein [Opitutaceae bacterium]